MNTPNPRAVFLDRDGVLNRTWVRDGKPYPPRTVEELVIFPDVAPSLERLKSAGLLRIVVTNQPDVGRGTQRQEIVEAIHGLLFRDLALDDLFVCYEDDDDCPERKPNPGMLLQAARKHGIDLKASYMIGDRWKDVEAGQRAGCRTIFLERGYREQQPTQAPDFTTGTLSEAVDWLLAQEG